MLSQSYCPFIKISGINYCNCIIEAVNEFQNKYQQLYHHYFHHQYNYRYHCDIFKGCFSYLGSCYADYGFLAGMAPIHFYPDNLDFC